MRFRGLLISAILVSWTVACDLNRESDLGIEVASPVVASHLSPYPIVAPSSVFSGSRFLEKPAGAGRILGTFTNAGVIRALRMTPTNRWISLEDDKIVIVWAGEEVASASGESAFGSLRETGRGLVIIQEYDKNPYADPDWFANGADRTERLVTDSMTGPLFVVDATRDQVVVKGADGTTWSIETDAAQSAIVPADGPLVTRTESGEVLQTCSAEMSVPEVHILNCWHSTSVGSSNTLVVGRRLAYAESQSPDSYLAIVHQQSGEGKDPLIENIDTPRDITGPVWIYDETGGKVILMDQKMSAWVYDMVGRRFLTSAEVQTWGGLKFGSVIP